MLSIELFALVLLSAASCLPPPPVIIEHPVLAPRLPSNAVHPDILKMFAHDWIHKNPFSSIEAKPMHHELVKSSKQGVVSRPIAFSAQDLAELGHGDHIHQENASWMRNLPFFSNDAATPLTREQQQIFKASQVTSHSPAANIEGWKWPWQKPAVVKQAEPVVRERNFFQKVFSRAPPHHGGKLGGRAVNMANELESTIATNVAADHVKQGMFSWVPERMKPATQTLVKNSIIAALRMLCRAKNSKAKFLKSWGNKIQTMVIRMDPNNVSNPAMGFASNVVFNTLCNVRRLDK